MLLFLSHSWHDKPLASDLAAAVRALAPGDTVAVWHDCERLRLGGSILDGVEQGLAASDLVTVLWTPEAARSDGVLHEIDHATRLGKQVVACRVRAADVDTPDLPRQLGRSPLALDLSMTADEEELAMVAAALVEHMVRDLAADEEVSLPQSTVVEGPMSGLGATLRHLLPRLGDESVQRYRGRWPGVLGRNAQEMTESGERLLDQLATSTEVMNAVLTEVERRPTDVGELKRLRGLALELAAADPTGSAQAVKVIDLRLADPH
ncbi:MAG: toll/interleukin-1 receptor domain-containing protein [Acidimicrobiales bacterium]